MPEPKATGAITPTNRLACKQNIAISDTIYIQAMHKRARARTHTHTHTHTRLYTRTHKCTQGTMKVKLRHTNTPIMHVHTHARTRARTHIHIRTYTRA